MNNWISIKDELPPTNKKVICFYKNECGKSRQVFGYLIGKHEVEAAIDSEFADYCEEKDEYFDSAGWYECIDNWDDFASVQMYYEPTHWRLMFEPPQTEGK